MQRPTRRQFLRAGGGAIVTAGAASQLGWLAGCGGNGSTKQPDWGALEKQLKGKLVRPGDPGY